MVEKPEIFPLTFFTICNKLNLYSHSKHYKNLYCLDISSQLICNNYGKQVPLSSTIEKLQQLEDESDNEEKMYQEQEKHKLLMTKRECLKS